MPEKIRIKVNRAVCSGCLSCMTTCSMFNEGYASLSAARVQVELSPFEGTNKITICQQCAKPKCMAACPEEAISRNDAGVMVVDYARCISCKLCVDACPFSAMFWNPIDGKVTKCIQCNGLVFNPPTFNPSLWPWRTPMTH